MDALTVYQPLAVLVANAVRDGLQKHVGKKKTRFAANDHILTLGTIGAGHFCRLSLCEASQVICTYARQRVTHTHT